MPNDRARYWLLTIPHHAYLPYPHPQPICYSRGQLERGSATSYLHWQVLVVYTSAVRLSAVKSTFGEECHAEPSRSAAARDYVWKDDTRVEGTQFEFGQYPMRRNSAPDWSGVRTAAISGQFDGVPDDIFVRHYNSLRRIAMDYSTCRGVEKRVYVYWGVSGTGKSHRAWAEAGEDAYPKDPRTKWWDGYRAHRHVVIDEFRGDIGISHILRWFDKYPCLVEQKGAGCPLVAETIWITSNLDPRKWYPDLDEETLAALLRRLTITHFPETPFTN